MLLHFGWYSEIFIAHTEDWMWPWSPMTCAVTQDEEKWGFSSCTNECSCSIFNNNCTKCINIHRCWDSLPLQMSALMLRRKPCSIFLSVWDLTSWFLWWRGWRGHCCGHSSVHCSFKLDFVQRENAHGFTCILFLNMSLAVPS